MGKDDIKLSAQKREVLGKKVKQLRDNGETPAVIHERGKDSTHVILDTANFKKVLGVAGKHHAIKIDVDGKKYTTLVKDVIYAPARTDILHAVFQAIKEDEKVTAEIPLKLTGEIPAERASLLVLKSLESITVEALPKDLVDSVEVNAEVLADVGDRLHVSDISLPNAITLKTDPETVIATVEMPKDQIAEADAALAEQAEQEGETTDGEEGEAAEGGADEEGSAEGEKPAEEKTADSENKES